MTKIKKSFAVFLAAAVSLGSMAAMPLSYSVSAVETSAVETSAVETSAVETSAVETSVAETSVAETTETRRTVRNTVVLDSAQGDTADRIKETFESYKETEAPVTVKLVGDFSIDEMIKIYSNQTLDATDAVITGSADVFFYAYRVENVAFKGGTWKPQGTSQVVKISSSDQGKVDSLNITGGGPFGYGSIYTCCSTNVTVTGCTVKNVQSEAIYAYKTNNFTIANCVANGTIGHALRVYGCNNIYMIHNQVDNVEGDGISCSHCNTAYFTGNVISNVRPHPKLDMDPVRGWSRSGCGILISESTRIKAGRPYKFGSTTYQGNTLMNCDNYGIHITTSYDTDVYKTSIIETGSDGIHNSAASYTTVKNCNIEHTGESGISFLPGPVSTVPYDQLICKNAVISDNVINQCKKFGVFLSASQGTNLVGNTISNCTDYGVYCLRARNIIITNSKITNTKNRDGTGIGETDCVNVQRDSYLVLNKADVSLGKGESYQLSTNNTSGITWSSSNTAAATVYNGRVTAKNLGTATITAKSSNGMTATCRVTVKAEPSSVTLSKQTLSLGVGEKFSLSAIVTGGSAAAVRTFRTSNSNIIKMTKTDWVGEFIAQAQGTAWVTVRLYNGLEASCKITVKRAPTTVSLEKTTLTMGLGETCRLGAVLQVDSAAATRTFRSDNNTVVNLSKTDYEATFKALRLGTATITVRLYNGIEASCKVTVKKAPTWVTVDKKTLSMKVGQTAELNSTIARDAGAGARVFRTSDSSIVKMLNTKDVGRFKATKRGVAWVTVRLYNGKEASCKITVT